MFEDTEKGRMKMTELEELMLQIARAEETQNNLKFELRTAAWDLRNAGKALKEFDGQLQSLRREAERRLAVEGKPFGRDGTAPEEKGP
jgi:chromosome segregation ATPase